MSRVQPNQEMLNNDHILKRILIALGLALLALLQACDSKKEVQLNQVERYELEVLDSVSIDRLSEVVLMDYNEQTEELLLHDKQTNEILVVGKEGQLISSFNPFVEGPDHVGSQGYGWNFFEKDKIIGYGQVHFHLLTKAGKRLKRLTYPAQVTSWWILDYNPKMLFTFEYQNSTRVLAFVPGVMGAHILNLRPIKTLWIWFIQWILPVQPHRQFFKNRRIVFIEP